MLAYCVALVLWDGCLASELLVSRSTTVTRGRRGVRSEVVLALWLGGAEYGWWGG